MNPTRPRLADIIKATSECSGIPLEKFCGRYGPRAETEARWCAAWVSKLHGYSILQIANKLGQHYTPVLYGIGRIDAVIASGDRAIIADLETIDMRAKELTRAFRGGFRRNAA